MATHTPVPWAVGKPLIRSMTAAIETADGRWVIAHVDCMNEMDEGATNAANAAFIARACNNHEALLAALKGLLRYDDEEHGGARNSAEATVRSAARAAIAAAERIGMNTRTCKKEWSGSPAPESPDEWWIDDDTGEYVRASDGERMSAEEGRAAIARAEKGE